MRPAEGAALHELRVLLKRSLLQAGQLPVHLAAEAHEGAKFHDDPPGGFFVPQEHEQRIRRVSSHRTPFLGNPRKQLSDTR